MEIIKLTGQGLDMMPKKRIPVAKIETAGKPVVTITSPEKNPAVFYLEIESDVVDVANDIYVTTFRAMVDELLAKRG